MGLRLSAGFIIALSCAALTGCRPASSLPLHKASSDGPTGILTGVLLADSRCLYLADSSGHRWLVVWPDGYSREGDTVLDERRTLVGAVGDELTLGGGEVPTGSFDFLNEKLVTEVPASCRGSDYWVASGLAPSS